MALDAKSLAVTEFLTALKACEDILRDLANKLRLRPDIVSATSFWPRLEDGPYDLWRTDGTIERFYAAVQFEVAITLKSIRKDGWRGSEWLVEVYWNEAHWLIETRMRVDGDAVPNYGPSTLRYFPERYADTLDELIIQTQAAAKELVENIDTIDEAIALDKALI